MNLKEDKAKHTKNDSLDLESIVMEELTELVASDLEIDWMNTDWSEDIIAQNNLTPLERRDIQIRAVIDGYIGPLGVERTWDDNLHVVDILEKHVFKQLLEKKDG